MSSKKVLKAAYKLKTPDAGVFQIKNNKNGRVLIEASPDIQSKWNRHRTELRFGSHRNKVLQKDWNEYGEENFIFSVLSQLEVKDDDNVDLNSKVKLLREMIEEELGIPSDIQY